MLVIEEGEAVYSLGHLVFVFHHMIDIKINIISQIETMAKSQFIGER